MCSSLQTICKTANILQPLQSQREITKSPKQFRYEQIICPPNFFLLLIFFLLSEIFFSIFFFFFPAYLSFMCLRESLFARRDLEEGIFPILRSLLALQGLVTVVLTLKLELFFFSLSPIFFSNVGNRLLRQIRRNQSDQ